jgi:hypothetical protein
VSRPAWVSQLLERGSVPYSQVNQVVLADLQSLQLVVIQLQGNRRRIVVHEPEQFRVWAAQRFPAMEAELEELAQRGRNIAGGRNSKAGPTTHAVQPIVFKWFDTDPRHPLSETTQKFGLVAATSDRLAAVQWPAVWWLLTVENWESFYRLNYSQVATPLITIYLGGQVPDVTLTKLAEIQPQPAAILHFGDYDWTGLAIFQRVQAKWSYARLYVPGDLEGLFQRYSQRLLASTQTPPIGSVQWAPDCLQVIDLIARYNAGLEQEIVLPPTEADFR